MSSQEVPATRALATVLRRQLMPEGDPVRLLIGVGASPPAGGTANGYVNVTIGGQTIQMPRLRDARQPTVGGPAYVLAGEDFLLYIGTVTLV